MKILFLGTAAGWPLPRLGCRCSLCSSSDPKDKRLRPSVLVNDKLLLDAGPDVYHQLMKYQVDIGQLEALVLTHAHPDHILGFYDLTHLYHRGQKTLFLVGSAAVINGLKQSHRYPFFPFKPKVLKPQETFVLGNLKISLLPVKHGRQECFAVKVKDTKRFVYLPDVERVPKSERRSFRDLDLLVLDGSSLDERGQSRIHLSIKEGLKLAQDLQAKQVYFTHLGHLSGAHQALEAFVQQEGGQNFHLAYDGLQLII